jgi:hypothetical protein
MHSVFYCLSPFFLFGFFIAVPFSPSFSPLFSLFFGSCGFHLYPTPTCLGIKVLVVVMEKQNSTVQSQQEKTVPLFNKLVQDWI